MKQASLFAMCAVLLSGFVADVHAARGIVTTKPGGGGAASGKILNPADSGGDASTPSSPDAAAKPEEGKKGLNAVNVKLARVKAPDSSLGSDPVETQEGNVTIKGVRVNINRTAPGDSASGAKRVLPTVNK